MHSTGLGHGHSRSLPLKATWCAGFHTVLKTSLGSFTLLLSRQQMSTLAALLLSSLCFLIFVTCGSVESVSSGTLLDQALRNVLGAASVRHYKDSVSDGKSKLRIRCREKLACEFFPAIEAENVIFQESQAILSQLDDRSKAAVKDMGDFYASKSGHFPSMLAQTTGGADWVAGPKISMSDKSFESVCSKSVDTAAYFIFPWETQNAFHSLNDNLMAIMASVVLQYITSPPDSPNAFTKRTLYHFPGTFPQRTMIYRLLNVIFDGDVRPASEVMKGGPHCFARVTWGSAMKIFYRDSLMDLRRLTHDVLKEVLHLYVSRRDGVRLGITAPASAKKRLPKVVIVTRNDTQPLDVPARKIAASSEQLMLTLLHERGLSGGKCCDYKWVNSVDKFIDQFLDVDVCIGLHGAGMSNCILGASGMVMVEYQSHHAFGFDSFMKIAHMSQGQYIFHDIRGSGKKSGPGAGSLLERKAVESMLDLALRTWNYSQRALSRPLEDTGFRTTPVLARQRRSLQGAGGGTKGYVWQQKSIDMFNSRKQYIDKVVYRGEVVLDYATKTAYYHHSSTELERRQRATLGSILGTPDSDLGGFREEDMSKIQTNTLSKALTVESVYGSGASNDGGSNLVRLAGPQVFWLMLNPYTSHAYTTDSVLGPKLDDNFNHCVSLPYYKFRTMTTNFKEHRGECDKNVIFTKRKQGGAIDGRLQGKM